jgi:hypothetical protein
MRFVTLIWEAAVDGSPALDVVTARQRPVVFHATEDALAARGLVNRSVCFSVLSRLDGIATNEL